MRRQDPLYSLNLVECVEKYPCLYDFNLGEYSVRDITNAAWERVAAEIKDTAANCRKYWRHLRIVFARNLKKDPYCVSSSKSLLQEKMMFLKPFMKITDIENASLQRNSPPINFKEEPDDHSSSVSTILGDSAVDYYDNSDIDRTMIKRLNEDFIQSLKSDEQHREWSSNVTRIEEYNHHLNSNGYKDNNASGAEKKKRKLDQSNSNHYFKSSSSDEHQDSYRRHYLISLLPDIEEMNNQQFRLFRKKVDDFIADIL